MPGLLKWLIFTALCALYVWAVFLWDRSPESATSQNSAASQEIPKIETADDNSYSSDGVTHEEFADSFETEENDLYSEEVYNEEQNIPTVTSAYSYYVISGSYIESNRAKLAQQKLQKKGVQAEIMSIGSYFKVVVGKYNDLEAANSKLNALSDQGIPGFIQAN